MTNTALYQRADAAVRTVLETQWHGAPLVVVNAAPGAGKSALIELLAGQAAWLMEERCWVATQTNQQALDLALRMSRRFPRHRVHLLLRPGLIVPDEVRARSNIVIIRSPAAIPTDASIVLANATRWASIDLDEQRCHVLLVDESYQLTHAQWLRLRGLALHARAVLVGDPGQLAPVTISNVTRWVDRPDAPHIPAPRALLACARELEQLTLPISRRLPADTVDFVQPALYPAMPFKAQDHERRLILERTGPDPLDAALDLGAEGTSLLRLELPAGRAGLADQVASDAAVALLVRLLERGAKVLDGEVVRPLTPAMLAVACPHVAQAHAVRERLPRALHDVLVDTANRLQGAERSVVIAISPLARAGAERVAGDFVLDAGRLCVQLTRHRIACFELAPAGMEELLIEAMPTGSAGIGGQDAAYRGWEAHRSLTAQLIETGRVLSLAQR